MVCSPVRMVGPRRGIVVGGEGDGREMVLMVEVKAVLSWAKEEKWNL